MAYVLFPGYFTDKYGVTRHRAAQTLARLHNIDYYECKIVYRDDPTSVMRYEAQDNPDDIEIYPNTPINLENI